ncbi:membrane protein OxaA [Actinoplanes sp. OR16]|uniref:membrane protein insertase YidC n=1 Tax=Actinoplanes sp. OR16 TaxID=946334 RepID=UPI000F6C83E8|nr:membrane protein insertase YidC [Actinoplanes sp. OR16]BBH70474.1 membrane protein OxaA [Actinoplanes sp. OR16]
MMEPVYTAISAILLFWHAVWDRLVGHADVGGTSWAWVLGIVFLVLTVRIALFPVIIKQVRSQRATQRVQPQVKALQEKHKGDRETLQQELAKLFQEEKVSPFAQFLPMLVQIPVVIGLLHVLRHLRPEVTSEVSRTLYGWTLTQFDSAINAELFTAPLTAGFSTGDLVVKLVAAVLIAIMTVTTYLTTRQMISKSGWATDEPARTVQRIMLYGLPLSLLVSGALFPIGVVLYWVTQNIFALGQQAWILRRYPVVTPPATPPAPKSTVAPPKVGVKPTKIKS